MFFIDCPRQAHVSLLPRREAYTSSISGNKTLYLSLLENVLGFKVGVTFDPFAIRHMWKLEVDGVSFKEVQTPL
jgi:hypothetical protein